MSAFSPEAILFGLIQRMGVTPAQVQEAMGLITKVGQTMAEVDAFKRGSTAVVSTFSERLDRIETSLARLESLLSRAPGQAIPPGLITHTGELQHERNGH